MATETEVRKLKVGDIICWCNDEQNEVIEEIIFDNYEWDMKANKGDRVTINGMHWNFCDVTIVESANSQ